MAAQHRLGTNLSNDNVKEYKQWNMERMLKIEKLFTTLWIATYKKIKLM